MDVMEVMEVMEVPEVPEMPEYKRKLFMIIHLPLFMDLTPEQREREDQFFGEMHAKGYYTRTMHGTSEDIVGLYTTYLLPALATAPL